MKDNYWEKSFNTAVLHGNDEITVYKNSGGDWIGIEMQTNKTPNGSITIRSKEHAEQLHFLLGQMLGVGQ
jgi:hypothetical protein